MHFSQFTKHIGIKLKTFLLLILVCEIKFVGSDRDILADLTLKIGTKLWDLGCNLTKNADIKSAYNNANLTELNGKEIAKEMSNRAYAMIELKKNALQRIVNIVEEYSKNLSDSVDNVNDEKYTYLDAKKLSTANKSSLTKDRNFFNIPVSTNFSTVHIPTDVYFGTNETLLGIYSTKELDNTFRHNYISDPTLSWQYFAGVSGFMRIFPGIEWPSDGDQISDLYDARKRPWYIEAATDPKDIVILIDNSGSMMGQKRKIARHTVNSILETLGPNDFVNIFQFSYDTESVVGCFNDSLVQANLVTIRELKIGAENMKNAGKLANFTRALTKAFAVLQNHQREHLASMCNQAIMLITDGVPENYYNIFSKYNWRNSTEPPFPVRVFTYQIGRDGADFRETKWIACANQGYFVQLNTMQEVKEQVFNYMNVLARPLVLRNIRKIAWTSLYVHKKDPRLTDYYWQKKQNAQQRENSVKYRDDWKSFLSLEEQRKRRLRRKQVEFDQNKYIHERNDYQFMITLSHPAYDQRQTKNITENILINEAYWTQRVFEANVASLLGVAATDIPIEEFKKIMKPHYLGVNNYGFIVNNNGYIIIHPDLRPFFRETLKPGYNSVDMLEIELLDNVDPNKLARDFDIQVQMINNEPTYTLSNLSLLRDFVINQTDSSNHVFSVKYHYDNMRRVSFGRRHYHISRISNSPFTLVLALFNPTGKDNFQPCRIAPPKGDERVTITPQQIKEFFGGNWNIHPDWFYCKFNHNSLHYQNWSDRDLQNRTAELLYFFKKMNTTSFWDDIIDPYGGLPQENSSSNAKKKSYQREKNIKKDPKVSKYFCDRELIKNLLYDANITKNIFDHLNKDLTMPPDFNFPVGSIRNVFVATHSGLTRWKDLNGDTSFGRLNNKTIDEIWYRRAIHQYYANEKSFVFSIPLFEDYHDKLTITATHAIFVKENKKKGLESPAAVVGYQLMYPAFENYIRTTVEEHLKATPNSVLYYVLDNNGYILATNNYNNTGKFFGEIQPELMRSFKECGIFKEVIVYDYQGVCFENPRNVTSGALSLVISPIKQIHKVIAWTMGTLIWGIIKINIEIIMTGLVKFNHGNSILEEEIYGEAENFTDDILSDRPPKYSRVKHIVMINRTRPQTCDRKVKLYNLEPQKNWVPGLNCANVMNIIKPIPYTNLLLVVPKNTKEEDDPSNQMSIDPVKIKYDIYNSPVCYKVNAVLSRRRPSSCSKNAKEEKKITLCGGSNSLTASIPTLAVTVWVIIRWSID